ILEQIYYNNSIDQDASQLKRELLASLSKRDDIPQELDGIKEHYNQLKLLEYCNKLSRLLNMLFYLNVSDDTVLDKLQALNTEAAQHALENNDVKANSDVYKALDALINDLKELSSDTKLEKSLNQKLHRLSVEYLQTINDDMNKTISYITDYTNPESMNVDRLQTVIQRLEGSKHSTIRLYLDDINAALKQDSISYKLNVFLYLHYNALHEKWLNQRTDIKKEILNDQNLIDKLKALSTYKGENKEALEKEIKILQLFNKLQLKINEVMSRTYRLTESLKERQEYLNTVATEIKKLKSELAQDFTDNAICTKFDECFYAFNEKLKESHDNILFLSGIFYFFCNIAFIYQITSLELSSSST
ncbi:MAG: hypothetical protein ACK5V4_07000, partial [Alphaproteobacteria bacterium]